MSKIYYIFYGDDLLIMFLLHKKNMKVNDHMFHHICENHLQRFVTSKIVYPRNN